MIKIFVSSTFIDLADYRSAILEFLRQGGFYDVAMETFGARDERPQMECRHLIGDSDYFVGVYAHRYGHIPNESEISITEEEYHAAGDTKLKRLIYVVDPKTPWIPDYIDRGKDAEKLAQFKGLLMSRHICKPFTSPDNLAKSVLADLGREVRTAQLKPINPMSADSSPAKPWTQDKYDLYKSRRSVELVHVIEEPNDPMKIHKNVLIYLFRHRPYPDASPFGLDDVEKAEFYLGKTWGDKVFTCENNQSGGYIGIIVHAYGSTMCLCRVTFTDGKSVILNRYIDFESQNELSKASERQLLTF